MHIAIDTTPLESGHRLRGVGYYAKLLIEALQKYKRQHSYSFFTRGQNIPKHSDLVHYPYFDPFFLTLPLFNQKPTVVTVHDLIPIRFSNHFPAGLRGEFKWQLQKLSLGGAARIITDSNASKIDIHELVGFTKERIDVVYLAPSPVFRVISNHAALEHIRDSYHLPEHFILYVGDVNWNKNIQGLVKAFDIVRRTVIEKELSLKTKLVFVGKAFFNDVLRETQEINKLIHSLGLSEEIVKPGFVPEQDLVGLYNLASIYVQPSFAEGFGLPVLEAMACGCPVVAAAGSSLSEISGPAISVNTNSPQDIARGILRVVLFSSAERRSLIDRELDWVRSFSWKNVAAATVASYEKCIDYHPGV